MAEEHEETPIRRLSREELEERMATATFIEQHPAVFQRLALHPHVRDGVPHLDGNYAGIDLARIIAPHAIMECVYIPRANLQGADLSGADCCSGTWRQVDLSGATLVGVNFSSAYLNQADLSEANLSDALMVNTYAIRANFHNANLSGANLSTATLIGANLTGANLTKADLSGADLTQANLTRAILTGANLSGTDLDGAYVFETVYTRGQFDDAGYVFLVNGELARMRNPYDDEEGYG